MCICFKDHYEAKKFFARCMYVGQVKDNTSPMFSSISMSCNFKQVVIETDKSILEVENLLKENKVKYEWVSQY